MVVTNGDARRRGGPGGKNIRKAAAATDKGTPPRQSTTKQAGDTPSPRPPLTQTATGVDARLGG